ncbi:Fic family protein [Salegentibacter sp. F188]|uniref:Fic family protein n=1 Tax=Autumnicola patrickiae TaxID=3075591 RepID=A0ABU3DZF7_9FLAO|nr:Fic family protein [Salegentibacter sp. F188]MDT0689091.1 Fic family protein [Salegentibacter sp. F188]
MAWNWQLRSWSHFEFTPEVLLPYEKTFLQKAGMLYGSMKHISNENQDELKIMLLSDEAFQTSKIEGELLDRDSLQSSIRKHFDLQADKSKVSLAEDGVSKMMIDLYRNYSSPLTHEQLFLWHEMLMNERRDLQDIGSYRTHKDPMQIVSGSMGRPIVHFEAPPSSAVKKEMDKYISWFNDTGDKYSDSLVKSGIAHLYFESIHPFEDGNGRIGRALSEKVLSQYLERPTLIALSHVIENNKKLYYSSLHLNSKEIEITGWLEYFCETILQAQDYTQRMIDFTISKTKYFQEFDEKFNERQRKVVNRIFREGIEGFKGGLSADNYIKITGTTASTATRDLKKMVDLGAFIKTGERKSTRYQLNLILDN